MLTIRLDLLPVTGVQDKNAALPSLKEKHIATLHNRASHYVPSKHIWQKKKILVYNHDFH